MERELRDELADSISKAASDADRSRITELEKVEVELRVEVSRHVRHCASLKINPRSSSQTFTSFSGVFVTLRLQDRREKDKCSAVTLS